MMLQKLWYDEAGVIISAELVLILTIAVLAMVVGLSEAAVAVNNELNDLSNAFGSLNQSYNYTGFIGDDAKGSGKQKSQIQGGNYADLLDDCDGNTSCDLVCGAVNNGAETDAP